MYISENGPKHHWLLQPSTSSSRLAPSLSGAPYLQALSSRLPHLPALGFWQQRRRRDSVDRAGKEKGPRSRCHIWGQRLRAERPGAGPSRWAQGLRTGRGGAQLPATCGLRSGRQSVRSSDDCAAPPGPQRHGRSLLPPPPPGPARSEHARAGVCRGEPAPWAVGSAPRRPPGSQQTLESDQHRGKKLVKPPRWDLEDSTSGWGERAWWKESDAPPGSIQWESLNHLGHAWHDARETLLFLKLSACYSKFLRYGGAQQRTRAYPS
ncbi:hypothetical protein NN561_002953 [Cricetulus griseus]